MNYILTATAGEQTRLDFVVEPDYCPLTYVITADTLDAGTTAITINADSTLVSVYWDADDSPLDQQQEVTVTATSTSKYNTVNSAITFEDKFDVTFQSPCDNEDLITLTQIG